MLALRVNSRSKESLGVVEYSPVVHTGRMPASGRFNPERRYNDSASLNLSISTGVVSANILQSLASDMTESFEVFDFFVTDRSEKPILDKGFATLAAFALEPDQPRDEDLVVKPIYRFPNR